MTASLGLMAALPVPPVPLACQSSVASLSPTHQLQVQLPIIQPAAPSHSAPDAAIFSPPVVSFALPLILQPDSSLPPLIIMPEHAATPQMSAISSVPPISNSDTAMPHVVNDVTVLHSCQLDIENIQHAQDLRDAVEQVENGAVSHVHEHYGPRDDRAADEMWDRLKGKIMKHERLYALLTNAFKGDKDSFFDYFTISESTGCKNKKQCSPSNLKGSHCGHKLVGLHLVVEAIPHCQKDLQDERRNAVYVDPVSSCFSEELWMAVWGDQNNWHVWRALGKECYGSKKAQALTQSTR